MIYPTRTAIWTAAAGAPATLIVALLLPGRWYAALAWPVAVLLASLADALRGSGPSQARLSLDLPKTASVGAEVEGRATVTLSGAAPSRVEIMLEAGPLLEQADEGLWIDLVNGKGAGIVPLRAARRGTARVPRVWLRWKGSLGLVWKQRIVPLDVSMAILPDIRPVHERGAQIFQRHALQGLMAQADRGDGADFDALVEFRSGMDRRAIDWKQSARHSKLHAKEFRTERNNQIVFAIDAGRQMSEPVAGLSRLDRVVSAMLLTAWVALKLGDRVALHAFDSRPRIAGGLVSGAAAFGELQRLAAQIDYSGEETNYTHALTTLATRLTRRSMIVLFTEFTDLTSAEFLVRAAARMVETHLLMVVVLHDEELEAILDRRPESADDVTRAVTAAALLRDRMMALTRLRHLGAHVIEAEHDRVADRLVQGYVDLKRRNLL
ncbi:DUF58 domain-containing protein [Sphingobium sp. YR768]|uniref:DUF58 domain-containing protein n=1 Tax=Sphingobium sp. YR768 TaxID=1884365 RepID=UPI0008B54286|nr:DUF58 domain-containing protein [Sphingobium sp. YR768]SEQ84754.1 Uncharacterized conserved protein, DUF58 family, contains vWF domain [Sphingobium sp. YR768]